ALDAQGLGCDDADIPHIRDGRKYIAREGLSLAGLRRSAGSDGDQHLRGGGRWRVQRRVAQYDGATWNDRSHPIARKVGDLERQQTQLFVDRDGIADGERCERLPDGSIGIEILS